MSYILHWLTEASIGAAILIAVILLLRALLRERVRPVFFYAAWMLVAVRLLVPFSIPGPASVFNALPDDVPMISSYVPMEAASYNPAAPSPASQGDGVATEAANLVPSEQPSSSWTPESIAVVVWASGALLISLYVLLVNVGFRARLRGCELPRNHVANLTYRSLCRRLRMRPLRLCQCALASPCVFGVIRPRIVLTSASMADEKTLTFVLLHESCHVRQGDALWGVVRAACCILFWFHPLVWVAASVSREDAELSCDAQVLKHLSRHEALDYADTLVALVRAKKRPPSVTLGTSMAGKRGMSRRLAMIVKRKRTYGVITAICLIVTLAIGVAACTGRQQAEILADDTPPFFSPTANITPTPAAASATPEPTPRPLTAREEMAAIAALAESALPWNAYADMPQGLLAPFAAQLEQDFALYGRVLSQGTDEPTFYILLKPKEHYTLPEIGAQVSGPDWCALEDTEGNEFIRVEGESVLISFWDGYGMVSVHPRGQMRAGALPPVYEAVHDGERLARNLSLNIYPVQPPGQVALQIHFGEYAGFYRLDDALQEEIEPTLLMAKTTTVFDLAHPADSTVYPLSIYLRVTYLEEYDFMQLLSDGSVFFDGKLLTDEWTKEVVHRALDALRDATGVDPRGFDFDIFSDLTRAELTMPDYETYGATTHTQAVDDPEKLSLLAGLFRNADRNGDGGCPYTGELVLHRAGGETITVMIATDSCSTAHIPHGGGYVGVDYRDSNKAPRATMESIFDEVPWQ